MSTLGRIEAAHQGDQLWLLALGKPFKKVLGSILLNFWISLGKVAEWKWSQILQFLLVNGLKSPRGKKLMLGSFLTVTIIIT